MARVEYTETYRETDLLNLTSREFRRSLRIDGTRDEIKELFAFTMSSLPRYNYPILKEREDFSNMAFKHLDPYLLKLLQE